MTFNFRFTQAGTFDYFCTVHGAAMTGVIRVNWERFIDFEPRVTLEVARALLFADELEAW